MGTFVKNLRQSGYVKPTVTGVLGSGLGFYFRKLRIDLMGGPPINQRNEMDSIKRKRAKLGATERWFARRRGGAKETLAKDHEWRKKLPGPPGGMPRGRQTLTKSSKAKTQGSKMMKSTGDQEVERQEEQKVVMTLLVPFTVGARLKERVQTAKDKWTALCGRRKGTSHREGR